MKQLSAFLYVKRNFKKVATIIIALMIGVFGVYFFSLATETTMEAVDISTTNLYKKVAMISMRDAKASDSLIRELQEDKNTDLFIPCKPGVGSIRYHKGLSSSTSEVFNLFTEDIEKFMDTIGIQLNEGTIPREGKDEILLNEKFMRQNNLKVGDVINSDLSQNIKFVGEYKISGTYTGEIMLGIINGPSKGVSREECYRMEVIYRSKDDKFLDLSKLINGNSIEYYDYSSVKEMVDKSMISLNLLTNSLSIFMIVILCLTLGNLNVINFMKRKKEVFILRAIGYKKKNIIFKYWRESLIACSVGYVLGILLATIGVFILNAGYFSQQGAELSYISLSGMISSLTIPIFVSIFCLIPVLRNKNYS